jgi:hypothetical protein
MNGCRRSFTRSIQAASRDLSLYAQDGSGRASEKYLFHVRECV